MKIIRIWQSLRRTTVALFFFVGVVGCACFDAVAQAPQLEVLDVRKIWDKAPHNAFTDLIEFRGYLYCAFREGDGHVSDDGKLRILRSKDGTRWSSASLVEWPGSDARDAKLSITSNGRLMLNGAIRFLQPVKGKKHQSISWISADGDQWIGPYGYVDGLGTWRWSVTWNEGVAYSFGYSGDDAGGCLYRSLDGKSWQTVVDDIYPDVASYGNETSLVFLENNEAICLLRRDGGSKTALLGFSQPPYTQWQWKDLGVRVGGPKMILTDSGQLLAAVRLYDDRARTSLCWIDPANVTITEAIELPSGGDTSYAGMVLSENDLWVSYYSSHEEKTSIYLAKIRVGK